MSCEFIAQLFTVLQCFDRPHRRNCKTSLMRLYRPVSRFRGFGLVKSINGQPKLWSEMAPSRNNSSAIERAKMTLWPQSSPRNDGPTLFTPGTEACSKRKAYIALGSNLGDRVGMVENACNEMSARGIYITQTSSLWETEPMYVLDQNSFVNGACEVGLCFFLSSSFCTSLTSPVLCRPLWEQSSVRSIPVRHTYHNYETCYKPFFSGL